MSSKTVTLSDGREYTLTEPKAGALRGVKLLDVLQLDAGAHAALLPRIGGPSELEFYQLGASDMMTIMTEVVSFFAPNEAVWAETEESGSPSGSKTPMKSSP